MKRHSYSYTSHSLKHGHKTYLEDCPWEIKSQYKSMKLNTWYYKKYEIKYLVLQYKYDTSSFMHVYINVSECDDSIRYTAPSDQIDTGKIT